MARLSAGRLRHRITIRKPVETETSSGGYATEWSDLAAVRAEVTGLDGRESVMGQVLQGISTYRVRIRWRGDITTAFQLRSTDGCFGSPPEGLDYVDVNIRSAVDPDGHRRELVIIADTASTRS